MLPLLSVIIPVYNVEKYLDECVTSVVNQTYQNLEIILVDDGSPDRCGEMCDNWAAKDGRIKVIHKQNQGLGFARNSGIDAATGDYMAFLDSDDYVEQSMYEKLMMKAIETDSDIVVSGYNIQNSDGTFDAISDFGVEKTFEKDEILQLSLDFVIHKGNLSSRYEIACRSVFRRKTITTKFLSEREIVSEDYHYQIAATLCASKVTFIQDYLFNYRYNSSGLSKNFSFEKFKKSQKLLEEVNKLYKPFNLSHTGDFVVLMSTFTTIKTIFALPLSDMQRKHYIREMAHNNVWKSVSIPYSDMTIKEKIIYFSMKTKMYRLLFWIMKLNYCFVSK